MDENSNKHSLRNEKLKANRTSETEEQRKERLRIRQSKKDNQKTTRGKEKVLRNRRPRETGPGNSQEFEAS